MTQTTVFNALLRTISALVLVFVVWQFAASLANPFLWPDILAVLTGLNELFSGEMFFRNTSVTFRAFLGGYMLAAFVGVALGAALVQVPPFRLTFGALISSLAAAPLVALAPLTILWFGIGGTSGKLAIAFIAAVFPIAGTIMDLAKPPRKMGGMVVADQSSTEIAPQEIRRATFAGLRIGVMPAMTAVLVCEMIGSDAGLGYVIMNSMAMFKVATLVAAFIAAAIPAILLARIIAAIEVRLSA